MMVSEFQGFETSILTDPQIHYVKDFLGQHRQGLDRCFFRRCCMEFCNVKRFARPLASSPSQMCELCGALRSQYDMSKKYQADF